MEKINKNCRFVRETKKRKEMSYSKGFRFKNEEIGIFRKVNTILSGGIQKNSQLFGLTMGEFSLIDIIHECLNKVGKSKVYIATWSAGIKDANQVKWMIESDLIEDFKIITDHSYVNRQAKYASSIEDLFGKENIRTSEIHAKFVLIKNENYNIVITSSMNLNANKTCELFTIYEDENLYKFLYDFVKNLFDNQQTGFLSDSKTVSETLTNFFNKKTIEIETKQKHWSDE